MRDLPVYSQRDPQWANNRLGTLVGATIGLYGCLLTCHAMKASYYGHNINPALLNNLYVQNNLFISGDLLSDADIHALYNDITLIDTRDYSNTPADLNYLQSLSGDPTITATLELDFDHNPNDGIQTHFVEFHSYDGKTLRIFDPWDGLEKNFSDSYGTNASQTIQKVTVYKGNITLPPPPLSFKPEDYIQIGNQTPDQIKVLIGDFGWMERQAIDGKLKDNITDITKLGSQVQTQGGTISELTKQRDEALSKVSDLTQENETLTKNIDELKNAQVSLPSADEPLPAPQPPKVDSGLLNALISTLTSFFGALTPNSKSK